jgi:O-antigen/teichoic acid export membrane protein
MPTPAAVVAAVGIAMVVLLVLFIGYVAAGGDSLWSLPISALAGVAAGIWFFLAWLRRDPKHARRRRQRG